MYMYDGPPCDAILDEASFEQKTEVCNLVLIRDLVHGLLTVYSWKLKVHYSKGAQLKTEHVYSFLVLVHGLLPVFHELDWKLKGENMCNLV